MLGYERGCWALGPARQEWAADPDLPELKKLDRFASPEEFVDQLRKLGMRPRSEKTEGNGLRLVVVTVEGKLQVRFVSRKYCRHAPYDLR